MGQKAHPIGLRIGINKTWDSTWFAGRRDYAKILHQDLAIRKVVTDRLIEAGVSQIEIQRNANQVTLNIHVARPGLAIGSQGVAIDNLRKALEAKFRDKFNINIKEIKKPYQNAYILAELIGKQIEKRIPYRRACKMAIERAMESGVKGMKVNVAGRLNGIEIARSEFFADGKIPLQTFRSNIDYAYYRAVTTYGTIGVKIWLYHGEIFN